MNQRTSLAPTSSSAGTNEDRNQPTDAALPWRRGARPGRSGNWSAAALARGDACLVQGVHLQGASGKHHFAMALHPEGQGLVVGLTKGA